MKRYVWSMYIFIHSTYIASCSLNFESSRQIHATRHHVCIVYFLWSSFSAAMEDEEGSGHSGKETIESLDERGWETHRSATKSEASDESGDGAFVQYRSRVWLDLDSVHGPLFRGQTRQLSQRVGRSWSWTSDRNKNSSNVAGGTLRKVFARHSKRVPAAAGKDCHA